MRKVIVLTLAGSLIKRAFGSWRDVRVNAGTLLADYAALDVDTTIRLLQEQGYFVCHVPSGARGSMVEACVLDVEEG